MKRSWDAQARLRDLVANGAAGQFSMRIDRAGNWYHDGTRIEREPLVRLFATALRRAPDLSYWLVTPYEAGRVEVEDVPFTMVELRGGGDGTAQVIELRTNLDDWVRLGPEHPLVMRPPPGDVSRAPYVLVRPGLEARVLRPVYFELVERAVPAPEGDPAVIGVWSGGRFFPLGRSDR